MGYTTEHDLLIDFKSSFIKSIKNKKNIVLLDEVKTNWGIVDLLGIIYNKEKLDSRKKVIGKKLPHLTKSSNYALSILQNSKTITIEELGQILNLKNGLLNSVVETLLNRGLISISSKNKIKLLNYRNNYFINEIATYEAKLNNWQKAIEQAERHLWFTNSSYVVLPTLSFKVKDRVVKTCTQKGVGLIVQSTECNFKEIVKPKSRRHFQTSFSWKVNETLISKGKINGSSFIR